MLVVARERAETWGSMRRLRIEKREDVNMVMVPLGLGSGGWQYMPLKLIFLGDYHTKMERKMCCLASPNIMIPM